LLVCSSPDGVVSMRRLAGLDAIWPCGANGAVFDVNVQSGLTNGVR
jgi:hypothetical protein